MEETPALHSIDGTVDAVREQLIAAIDQYLEG